MEHADLLDAPPAELLAAARERRRGGGLVTYSPKVFIPLTTLCRDVCGYCTFARPPRRGERAYLSEDEVLAIARAGAAAGCTEALFTLGDKPELRYKVAREELAELGCATTIEYLAPRREARARRDRPAPAPESRRHDPRRARAPSPGLRLDGDHARDDRRSTRGARWTTLGLAGQAARPPARDDRARRRASDPLHERDPDRDRRDAGRAARRPGSARRAPPPPRPPPGGDRPELPREARHADGRPRRAVARRPPLDDRRGAAAPARRRLGAGAAEPRVRRLSTTPRRRDRRLGRRLAGHDRPRESGGTVAGARAARRRDALARARARAAAARLPGLSQRRVACAADPDPSAPELRFARACARGWLASRRARRRSLHRRARSAPARDERRAGGGRARPALPCARRGAAARLRGGRPAPPRGVRRRGHATSSPGTSSTRTSATSAAASAPSRRGSSRQTCAVRRTSCRSRRSSAAPARPGSAARPRSASRVGSIPRSPATTTPSVVAAIRAELPDLHIHAFSALEIWQGATTLGLPVEDYLERLRGARARLAPRHRRRDPRRRGARADLPGQGLDRAVARGSCRRTPSRPALERDDHVRARRVAEALGSAPAPGARPAAGDGRIHRARTAAVRPHGGADLAEGASALGADVRRDAAPPRRRPAGAPSARSRTSRRRG